MYSSQYVKHIVIKYYLKYVDRAYSQKVVIWGVLYSAKLAICSGLHIKVPDTSCSMPQCYLHRKKHHATSFRFISPNNNPHYVKLYLHCWHSMLLPWKLINVSEKFDLLSANVLNGFVLAFSKRCFLLWSVKCKVLRVELTTSVLSLRRQQWRCVERPCTLSISSFVNMVLKLASQPDLSLPRYRFISCPDSSLSYQTLANRKTNYYLSAQKDSLTAISSPDVVNYWTRLSDNDAELAFELFDT